MGDVSQKHSAHTVRDVPLFDLDRHLKTGHMSTGQNRPTGSGASRRVGDYRMRSSDGKLRWVVRAAGREKSACVRA